MAVIHSATTKQLPLILESKAVSSLIVIATLVVLAMDLPLALLLVALPITLIAGACAVLASFPSKANNLAVHTGRRALLLLWLSVFVSFLFRRGDWVHSLWSIQYPLFGLLFGSGLILTQVWRQDLQDCPISTRRWNGATLGFVTALAFGTLPLLLTILPFGNRSLANNSGPLFTTLIEIAHCGFGGELPALMQPTSESDIARGIRIAPRIITVTIATSLFAAINWILFATIALLGRSIRDKDRRRSFLLISPLFVASAALSPIVRDRTIYSAIWKNEIWLVKAYGPTLLLAGLLAIVLFLAVRRNSRVAKGEQSKQISPRTTQAK